MRKRTPVYEIYAVSRVLSDPLSAIGIRLIDTDPSEDGTGTGTGYNTGSDDCDTENQYVEIGGALPSPPVNITPALFDSTFGSQPANATPPPPHYATVTQTTAAG